MAVCTNGVWQLGLREIGNITVSKMNITVSRYLRLKVRSIDIAREYYGSSARLKVAVSVDDGLRQPVILSRVRLRATGPDGAVKSLESTSDCHGVAVFEIGNASRGFWTLQVLRVDHPCYLPASPSDIMHTQRVLL
ncbi:MAG: hypothetical protein QXS20_07990 [Candidatus Thorarchaeota archaeon]